MEEEEKELDKKIKISSIDDLKNVPVKDSNVIEKKEEEPEKKNVISTNKSYQLPPLSLLDKPKKKVNETDNSVIERNIEILEKVLEGSGYDKYEKLLELNSDVESVYYKITKEN